MMFARTIRVSTRVKLALGLWCVCEMIAFAFVVRWIGVADAILLGMVSSILGFSMLRRAGAAALAKLRTRMEARGAGAAPHLIDETLVTLGAVALLLPGFLSDMVGLALAIPMLRQTIGARIVGIGRGARWSASPARHGPATIDLAPDEWQKSDPATRPIPKV